MSGSPRLAHVSAEAALSYQPGGEAPGIVTRLGRGSAESANHTGCGSYDSRLQRWVVVCAGRGPGALPPGWYDTAPSAPEVQRRRAHTWGAQSGGDGR